MTKPPVSGKQLKPLAEELGVTTTSMTNAQIAAAIVPAIQDMASSPVLSLPIQNQLPNNDFPNTTGWSPTNAGTPVASGNICTFTATAQNGQIQGAISPAYVAGHLYYCQAWVKSNSSSVYFYNVGGSQIYHSGSGNWECLAWKAVLNASSNFRIRDSRASAWTAVQVKKLVVVDLTLCFGAGFEPSLATMQGYLDVIDPTDRWFTGTANVVGVGGTGSDVSSTLLTMNAKLNNLQLYGQNIVVMGDSVMEGYGIPERIGVLTGATITNIAIGGSRMANSPIQAYDYFSMSDLADAIATGVWTNQIANQVTGAGDDNTAIVTKMIAIDWTKVNRIVICHGANDLKDVTLGTESDTTDATFWGALNHIVTTIQTAYPSILITFATPYYNLVNGANSDTTPVNGSVYEYQYIDIIKAAAVKYRCPVLDMLRTSGINAINATTFIYYPGSDVHPRTAGIELISQKIARFLLAN